MSPEREAQMRAWDTNQELWNEIDAWRAAYAQIASERRAVPTSEALASMAADGRRRAGMTESAKCAHLVVQYQPEEVGAPMSGRWRSVWRCKDCGTEFAPTSPASLPEAV